MATNQPIPGYYDRFSRETGWKKLLFRPGYTIQSAELNEIQSVVLSELAQISASLYSEGSILNGCNFTVDLEKKQVFITPGQVYASGFTHDVSSGTVSISAVGEERLGLLIEQKVVTETDDTNLLDPAIGAENYGYPGSHRLSFNYSYVVNNDMAVTLAVLQNGQLVVQSRKNQFLDQVMEILAKRTYEESGSYIVKQPSLELSNLDNNDPMYQQSLKLSIKNCVGYVQGWRAESPNAQLLIDRALDSASRYNEPFQYVPGVVEYSLDNPPVIRINKVVSIVQSPKIPMTRGSAGGGADPIPSKYQPVVSVVEIAQGSTIYQAGRDFVLSGNTISWAPSGIEPATGSQYFLTVQYTKTLTKGVRYLNSTAEQAIVVDKKAHLANKDVHAIVSLMSTGYGEVLNYSLDKKNGIITINDPNFNGNTVDVVYKYWVHSVEGDYLGRDSFRNPDDTVLLYEQDEFFKHGISLDVDGMKPVPSTQVYVDYDYALPRMDILVLDTRGILSVLKGQSGVVPKSPTIPDNVLKLAKLNLPAESWAEDISIERFGNQRLTMEQLRSMLNELKEVQYNMAVFQLHQESSNLPTPTDKLGIFADSFVSPEFSDMTHSEFSATFDFLARCVCLPQESEQVDLEGSGTSVKPSKDCFLLSYTEVPFMTQPYATDKFIVNLYGNVNRTATLGLDPSVYTWTIKDKNYVVTRRDRTTIRGDSIRHGGLLSHLIPATWWADNNGIAKRSLDYLEKSIFKVAPKLEWVVNANPPGQVIKTTELPAANVLGFGTLSKWRTVTENIESVPLEFAKTIDITVSSKSFSPGERRIQIYFDGIPVKATPAGTSLADDIEGTIKADSRGDFSCKIRVPANTRAGDHTIEAIGLLKDDLTRIGTVCSAVYNSETILEEHTYYITTHVTRRIPTINDVATLVANAFNVAANESIARAKSVAELLAASAVEAVKSGSQITSELAQKAITLTAASLGIALSAVAIAAIAGIIMNYAPILATGAMLGAFGVLTGEAAAFLIMGFKPFCLIDPIAQTFVPDTSCVLTSVELFFSNKPENPDEPVEISIVEVMNGVPTTSYLASSSLTSGQALASSDGSKGTIFKLDSPVYLQAGKEYAFIIRCNSNELEVHAGTVGHTDVSGNLVAVNPSIGVLLRSPNERTWESVPQSDVKFNLYRARFSNSGVIDFGTVTFQGQKSRFTVNSSSAEPTENTKVVFQYSEDGTTWIDFQPVMEVDLARPVKSLKFRAILSTDNERLSPSVENKCHLEAFSWILSGAYIHRMFSLPSPDSRYVDVYFDIDQPGNTKIETFITTDEKDWIPLKEVVKDKRQIDETWTEVHYIYDTGSDTDLIQNIRTKVALSSDTLYATPRIRRYRVIARSI